MRKSAGQSQEGREKGTKDIQKEWRKRRKDGAKEKRSKRQEKGKRQERREV